MEYSDKVAVVPFTEFTPQMTHTSNIEMSTSNAEKKNKSSQTSSSAKAAEKLSKLLRIILKIAIINGYDDDGRIRDENGDIIYQSDLVSLLQKAMSYEKVLIGRNEFIHLLYKAKVPPDLIVNDDMRTRLLYLYKTSPKSMQSQETQTMTTESDPIEESYPMDYSESMKRKRDDLDEQFIELPPSKRQNVSFRKVMPKPKQRKALPNKQYQTMSDSIQTQPQQLQEDMEFVPQSIKRRHRDEENEQFEEGEPYNKLRRSTRKRQAPERWIYPTEDY